MKWRSTIIAFVRLQSRRTRAEDIHRTSKSERVRKRFKELRLRRKYMQSIPILMRPSNKPLEWTDHR
jgi:hypothetical protein